MHQIESEIENFGGVIHKGKTSTDDMNLHTHLNPFQSGERRVCVWGGWTRMKLARTKLGKKENLRNTENQLLNGNKGFLKETT